MTKTTTSLLADARVSRIDSETMTVVHQIKAALQAHFGPRFVGLYLFGSRARQDHRPDSDVDLAVLLNEPPMPLTAADKEVLLVTYPIEIARGIHIQAWALPADALAPAGPATRRRLA